MIALCALAALGLAASASAGPWEPLFNGKDLSGWKQVNGSAPYTVVDGAIVGTTIADSPNSFLATERIYRDFVFECEVKQDAGPFNSGVQFRSESRQDVQKLDFKLSPGANSGIKYFVTEKIDPGGGSAIGLEYQLLDDEKHPDAKLGAGGNRTLGSLYDLIPRGPMPGGLAIVPKVGEWQHARIVVYPDNRVEHWLTGIKVVEYQRGSPLFAALVARSKYEKMEAFGLAEKGRLLLQDHGNELHFRSIKVRSLGRS